MRRPGISCSTTTTPLSAPPETPSTSRILSPSRPSGAQSFLPPLKRPVLPAGCGSSSPAPSSRGQPVPEVLRHFSERLGSLALPLPSLRSRSDEIPSLSSLYLNSLNLELGKQLSGFEPRAIEMLRQYPWPNNYTQFKNVLRALAALSDGPYIRAGTVADMLSKERTLRAVPQPASARKPSEQTPRRGHPRCRPADRRRPRRQPRRRCPVSWASAARPSGAIWKKSSSRNNRM